MSTLLLCLDSWKKQFNIGTVCFVADRAMMSETNLSTLESRGYQYVVAAKLLGDELAWTGEFSYKNCRLVVSYKNSRAKRDAKQREQVLNKIRVMCQEITRKI